MPVFEVAVLCLQNNIQCFADLNVAALQAQLVNAGVKLDKALVENVYG
jgi:hypothetical protein